VTARARLPNRRAAIAFDFEHDGARFHAHVGFYPNGEIGEIFLNAGKPDSALDAIASDSGLISLLMRRGATVAELRHSLSRGGGGKGAGSAIAAALDAIDAHGGLV
jgi:hypothetical protein